MQPKASNQALRQPMPAKISSPRQHEPKAFAERVAAPKQKFAPRVPAPKFDFPLRAAAAPSKSDATAIAHEPLRTRQGSRERLLRPRLPPAERPGSCPRQ